MTVSAVAPLSGPSAGGTNVTVTGTNFIAGYSSCRFGTVAATLSSVASSSLMYCLSPGQVSAGGVFVDVTNNWADYTNSRVSFTAYGAIRCFFLFSLRKHCSCLPLKLHKRF